MKLSVSAYRAHASAHKKILDTAYQLNYGSTSASHPHSMSAGQAGPPTCSRFQMILTICISVLLLKFSAGATISCDVSYYEDAFVITGTKRSFDYYPWDHFENIQRQIKFLNIKRDDVRHICRSYLPRDVDEVVFFDIQLEYIEPGVFENNTVQQVIIEGNHLRRIIPGVFSGTNIKSLVLNDNKIEYIQPDSFRDMFFLEAVALDDNKIRVWDSSWFKNAHVLHEVSFRNNLLTNLPEYTTKYMIDSYKKFSSYIQYGSIIFDNNNIRYIHPLAFKNLKNFGKISLSNNKLLELSDEVFKGLEMLSNLHMNTNNFICFSNNTVRSFKGVKQLYLGQNKLNKDCVDIIKNYFNTKNDLVYF